MESFFQDIKYAIRGLLKSPGFSAVALIVLGLGIGANTAIFSVVNAVLLRPLPFRDADRLMTIWETNPSRGLDRGLVSPVALFDWRDQKSVFDQVAAWYYPQMNLTQLGGEPERVRAVSVTDNFFSVLGVQPTIGRGFLPGEDKHGMPNIAVISDSIWRRRFNTDASIVGKSVTLEGSAYTIVGVAPAGVDYPKETEIWIPLGCEP